MTMRSARTFVAFGDVHFPQHSPEALAVLKNVVRRFRPDVVVCLGDMLDAKAFSTHAPDTDGDTPYETEVAQANELLDFLQAHSGRVVFVEGNHEYRIERWAARDRAGKAAQSLLSPRKLLSRGRKDFTYVPYENAEGRYSHFKLTPRLAAVHGWSYAQQATRRHLDLAQGVSVVHGHTHRADHVLKQRVWEPGTVEAMGAGCLCKLTPTYRAGSPVEWVNGFVQGFLGPDDHTLYFVPIVSGRCVLPNGKEIKT